MKKLGTSMLLRDSPSHQAIANLVFDHMVASYLGCVSELTQARGEALCLIGLSSPYIVPGIGVLDSRLGVTPGLTAPATDGW